MKTTKLIEGGHRSPWSCYYFYIFLFTLFQNPKSWPFIFAMFYTFSRRTKVLASQQPELSRCWWWWCLVWWSCFKAVRPVSLCWERFDCCVYWSWYDSCRRCAINWSSCCGRWTTSPCSSSFSFSSSSYSGLSSSIWQSHAAGWCKTLWHPLLPVPDRVKPSFVIFDIWALWRFSYD